MGAEDVVRCPRCSAFLLDDVVHLEDSETGLYAVVSAPVADHVLSCRCGVDVCVTSTQRVQHHPGQLTLVENRRAS
jgi:hypothetical protein